jgi:hypothetical protein
MKPDMMSPLLLLLLLLLLRFLRYDDPDSPILSERRSARSVQRKTIDASQYVDPEEMDFEGQEWLMPENAEPKPEKVRGLGLLCMMVWGSKGKSVFAGLSVVVELAFM